MKLFQNYFIEIALAAALFLLLFSAWWDPFAAAAEQAQEQVLRLHILANSDSPADQELKLLVRDRLLTESKSWFAQTDNKEESEAILQEKLPAIAAIAAAELQKQGSPQTVKVSLCREDFATRIYEGFALPSGTYDALRIEIGEGRGQNWWCILFPSLCIPAAGEEPPLPAQLRPLAAGPELEPRFALWEFCQKIQQKP